MFCRHCGNQVEENTEICTKCGCKVKEVTNKPSIDINIFTLISLIISSLLFIISLFINGYTVLFILLYIIKSTIIVLSIIGVYQSKDKKYHLLAWIALAISILALLI